MLRKSSQVQLTGSAHPFFLLPFRRARVKSFFQNISNPLPCLAGRGRRPRAKPRSRSSRRRDHPPVPGGEARDALEAHGRGLVFSDDVAGAPNPGREPLIPVLPKHPADRLRGCEGLDLDPRAVVEDDFIDSRDRVAVAFAHRLPFRALRPVWILCPRFQDARPPSANGKWWRWGGSNPRPGTVRPGDLRE